MALQHSVQTRSLLMPNDTTIEWWEHYCNKQMDVVGFPKGTECDWCGKTEEEFVKTKDLLDIGSTTQTEQNIIDSFNNKGQKGDDDFETWLVNEAPFVTQENDSYTVSIGDTTTTSTLTGLSPTFTIKDSPHFSQTKQKKLPLDILHKWYPEEMKETDD